MASSITVAIRVRPPNEWEQERLPTECTNESFFMGDGHLAASPQKVTSSKSLRTIVQVMDDKILVFDPKDPDTTRAFEQKGFAPPGTKRYKDMRYAFDRVFGEDARQVDVFEDTTRPLLDGLLNGFNATVFAYGATGCGKTHTISGTEDDPGIIYLTMAELFQRIEDKKDDMICEVSLSFLEIYNEEVRDLLVDGDAVGPRGGLAMRDDTSNRVTVAGLTEKHPTNADEVKTMVMQGNARRTQSPTHANQTSSRSHAVLQVNVTQTPRTAGTTELRTMATLSIIDLAGSERASATSNMGQRMIEGANINKSLLALGNCINALCESGTRTRHIPYRNSKLTRLLRFSLGGNCKTVMIVCVAPASNHYEDTQNTLKYANRAKDIKTKVSRNFVNVDRHVGQYVEAINRLNDEVAQLKAKLAGKSGAEGEIQRRKKTEAKAELDRVKADLISKADQTRRTLLEGAACEAHSAAARSRLRSIKTRLEELDSKAAAEPLSTDLIAEQALLRTLASGDEKLLSSDSPAQRQLQKASNSNAMFDATLRAVSERRSDRLDELGVEIIKLDAHAKRAEMDKMRAEAKESVLQAALDSQAKFAAEMVGLLARCTVMMGEGSAALVDAFAGAEPETIIRRIAESMGRVAQSNDQAFSSLIGATTASFQSARDSTLLKFTAHKPTGVAASRAPVGKPKPGPRTSFTAGHRRRSSLTLGHAQVAHNSPRRHAVKSPRRVRQSLVRAEPIRRMMEKKSVRWRDETSQGEIDDKGLGIRPAPPAQQQQPKIIAPLFLAPKPDGKAKDPQESHSEAEWEDERTEDSVSTASTSSSTSTVTSQIGRNIRNRLDPKRSSRPPTMSSLGEETEGEESPMKKQRSPRRAPLGEVINSPPHASDGSPSKSRANKSSSHHHERPSTPPNGSPSRQRTTVPGSASKQRRNSNIGPLRIGKSSRRRSSLIPRPSPPSGTYSYAYAQPRKTPSKKRRSSILQHGQQNEEGSGGSSLWVRPARPMFASSLSADSTRGKPKSTWR